MHDVQYYKSIFDKYGGMMRTTQLAEEKIFYPQREKLIADGYVEKIRRGYYQWINPDDFSEVGTVIRLFPDAILCMDTALRYYGYSDRTPGDCHLAVSKDSGKTEKQSKIIRRKLPAVPAAILPGGISAPLGML